MGEWVSGREGERLSERVKAGVFVNACRWAYRFECAVRERGREIRERD